MATKPTIANIISLPLKLGAMIFILLAGFDHYRSINTAPSAISTGIAILALLAIGWMVAITASYWMYGFKCGLTPRELCPPLTWRLHLTMLKSFIGMIISTFLQLLVLIGITVAAGGWIYFYFQQPHEGLSAIGSTVIIGVVLIIWAIYIFFRGMYLFIVNSIYAVTHNFACFSSAQNARQIIRGFTFGQKIMIIVRLIIGNFILNILSFPIYLLPKGHPASPPPATHLAEAGVAIYQLFILSVFTFMFARYLGQQFAKNRSLALARPKAPTARPTVPHRLLKQ